MRALRDDSVVKLAYQQEFFPLNWAIPGFCQRRTEYEVDDVEVAAGAAARHTTLAPPKS